MKIALKWNFTKEAYDDIKIPEEASILQADFSTAVKCGHCGKWFPFGECYTSKQIHNFNGIGYAVCEECSDRERDEMQLASILKSGRISYLQIIEALADCNHRAYVKAILCTESVSKDEAILDTLYDRYLQNDIGGLIDHEFYSIADGLSEDEEA